MAIQWNRGEELLRGAPRVAAGKRQNIVDLANMIQGGVNLGLRGLHNYRSYGLMGILDPQGEDERQKAEEANAELQARLGDQEDAALLSTEPDTGEPQGYEFSADPRDWPAAAAGLGGRALSALAEGPGVAHRASLVDLARQRGALARRGDELSRARALSATVATSTDPGGFLGKLAPHLGLGPGDVKVRPGRGAGGDPKSAWAMAWASAREKYGNPTTDQVREEALQIRANEREVDQHFRTQREPRPTSFDKKRELAERALSGDAEAKKLYDYLYPRQQTPAEFLAELEGRLSGKAGGGGPAAPAVPGHEDDDLLYDEEDDEDEGF